MTFLMFCLFCCLQIDKLVPGDEHGDGHEADGLAVHEEPLELRGGEGVGGEGRVHPLQHLRVKPIKIFF